MSMNCKLSGINGRLRSCLRLMKAKEPLHGPNCGSKWWRKLFWLLGLVTMIIIWLLSSFDGTMGSTWKNWDYCGEKSRVLLEISLFLEAVQNTFLGRMASRNCIDDLCEIRSLWLVKGWWWLLFGITIPILSCIISGCWLKFSNDQKQKIDEQEPATEHLQKQQQQAQSASKGAGKWSKKLLVLFVLLGIAVSVWLFWHLNKKDTLGREVTLANMCDERARMLQDRFNVSMNHVHSLAILVSTFHHGKNPSAIDQETFGVYTERTAFERPLTSGVAYALRVPHSEREQFEKQHGWTIKKMDTVDQTLVQDCIPEKLDPAPLQDEYAPVIFSQATVSHIVSIDMMSGKEDRENILRARASGKGVLTSPFKLLKSNHLGVVLTFAVYNSVLPTDATPQQRVEATAGYLGASYDIPSLVERLLQQLAGKHTISVFVYDTTNTSAPIKMYGDEVTDTGLLHTNSLDFGDPSRKHEMQCRFKQKPPLPWTAISSSSGVLVITLLVAQIFLAAINRIAQMEEDCRKMMELKVRAESADVAKSQFLATVSHEIRTPMTGVLGMLQLLMDSGLKSVELEYARNAHSCGKYLISLINGLLDQAKIESGKLELEAVPFDMRAILDNVLSLCSSESNEKGLELAAYVSDEVPEIVVGDPGRFQQIITNLVGNSLKFSQDEGHIFVSVHLADEVGHSVRDPVLKQVLNLFKDTTNRTCNTLSGFPVVDRWKSWENFKKLNSAAEEPELIRLLVTVEDTGVGIPLEAQNRIFTPFMQADSSTSRTYGGTGIGLSISKCLVDLMHGEIGFASTPGMGSTFSFTAALRKGESRSINIKWQHCDPVFSELRGRRALVVDSRSIRAEVTRYHLQKLNVSVEIVSTLRAACTYLSSTSSSSASTNLAMVFIDKDAWDKNTGILFQHLLKGPEQSGGSEGLRNLSKVFLMATSNSTSESNELKSAGLVDHVLRRPLLQSVLVACIQEAFGSRFMSQENKKKLSNRRGLLREKRILVVDDNVVNRKVAEGALKKYGAIVTCVESGKAAVTMLKPPHNFDACFMDLQMPEMDGFEATRLIRRLEGEVNEKIASGEASLEMFANVSHWHTPILAMTADLIQASSEVCMKYGMDDYVSKPFEDEQMYTVVARFFQVQSKVE